MHVCKLISVIVSQNKVIDWIVWGFFGIACDGFLSQFKLLIVCCRDYSNILDRPTNPIKIVTFFGGVDGVDPGKWTDLNIAAIDTNIIVDYSQRVGCF